MKKKMMKVNKLYGSLVKKKKKKAVGKSGRGSEMLTPEESLEDSGVERGEEIFCGVEGCTWSNQTDPDFSIVNCLCRTCLIIYFETGAKDEGKDL